MTERFCVDSIKKKNIVDMAVTFTAMMRIFAVGTKEKIARKLEESFSKLDGIESQKEYEEIHHSFCLWFIESIKTAEKTLKNGKLKPSRYASYGHAAKVFDIAIKVYVYYCCQPSPDAAKKLLPLLKGAVDTPIMNHLCNKYQDPEVIATTIEDVCHETYNRLQHLVLRDIQTEFNNDIFPVEYDDIMWNQLNRQRSFKQTQQGTSPAKDNILLQDYAPQLRTELMPKKGDVFKGKVNDLFNEDATGWRRRDISFFKHEISRQQRFNYPRQTDRIILKDLDGYCYELNFSMPESVDKVCLSTPSKLKPWYQEKGFHFESVEPDETVYFEYTGNANEFIILTKNEYDARFGNNATGQ